MTLVIQLHDYFKFSSSTERKHLTSSVEEMRDPRGLLKNEIWSRRQIRADKWSNWCPGKSEILETHYTASVAIQRGGGQMIWRRKLIRE